MSGQHAVGNRGGNASSKLDTAELRQRAIEMRKRGMAYSQIGRTLGRSVSTVHRYVRKELDRIAAETQETTAEVRELEAQRLDDAIIETSRVLAESRVGGPTPDPDLVLKSVATLLRISESRRRLFGADAPVKQQVDHTSAGRPLTPLAASLMSTDARVAAEAFDAADDRVAGTEGGDA